MSLVITHQGPVDRPVARLIIYPEGDEAPHTTGLPFAVPLSEWKLMEQAVRPPVERPAAGKHYELGAFHWLMQGAKSQAESTLSAQVSSQLLSRLAQLTRNASLKAELARRASLAEKPPER